MNSPKRILDRQQIEKQFDLAAATYDSVAGLQRRMGSSLLQKIVESNVAKEIPLVDLGCGTGELLCGLAGEGFSNLTGLDLSSQMIELAKPKTPAAKFLHADIENIPCEENQFEAAVSSAAIQWCDTDSAAVEIRRVLQPQGHLFLTTFVPGTLGQWHNAFTVHGFESRVHQLAEGQDVRSAFERAGFEVTDYRELKETVRFDSLESMFQSIKRLGATNAMDSRARRMTRSEYKTLKHHLLSDLNSNGQLELDFAWVQIVAT